MNYSGLFYFELILLQIAIKIKMISEIPTFITGISLFFINKILSFAENQKTSVFW
mgnify:CR=1 FL=1